MTEFCDFVPDDPSCQTDPVDPTPGGGDGGDGGDHHGEIDDWEDMKDMMGHNPMMGNLTYLHVAMGSAIMGALELFVWHEDDYYDDGEVLSSNTWEMLGMLHHYSHLGIMSILTVTQILSMFGILGEINMMAWMYAEMLEMVIGLVLKLGWMYTYEMAYQISVDDDSSSADQTSAAGVMSGVQADMTKSTVYGTAAHFALHTEHENWMYAQVMALPEEAQEKYMDKHGHGKKEHDDEMMEFVQNTTGYFTI